MKAKKTEEENKKFTTNTTRSGRKSTRSDTWPADSNTRGGAVRNWNERPHIIKERYTKPDQFRHEEDMEEEGSE